jgi:hypothetical protein
MKMPDAPTPIPVRVRGLLRGHDLDGDATLVFERDVLVVQVGRARLPIELRSLEGWEVQPEELHVHLEGGDVVSIAGTDPREIALGLERWAFALPEFTRSLRVLGTRRAAAGARRPEHDAFFAPLIAARGQAERASTFALRRAALDSRALRESIELRLRAFAAERYPNDAPERRALEAELSECVAPLLARFADLDAAEERLAASPDAERVLHWHALSRSLLALFDSADRCWPDLGSILADDRREARSRWSLDFLRNRRGGGTAREQGPGERRQEGKENR